MKRVLPSFLMLMLVLMLMVVIGSITCTIDHGLAPVHYEITGTILFYKGAPPENTDRVEVFALKEFPPEDPQNLLYLARSGAIDYRKGSEVTYKIQVSPTSYELIGVVWKEKGKDWNLTGLMGLYTGGINSFFPEAVSITQHNPRADSIDIYANWEIVSKDASISGDITYQGEWPEETSLLLLAVYSVKPTSDLHYLLFENVDYAQPLFVDSSQYRLAVGDGIYNYIVLYWVGESISGLSDLVAIGFYEDPDRPGEPGSVMVNSGDMITGIDIKVDFSALDFPKR